MPGSNTAVVSAIQTYSTNPVAAPGASTPSPVPNIHTPRGTIVKTARGHPNSEPETRNADAEPAFARRIRNTAPGTRRLHASCNSGPEFGTRSRNDFGARMKNPPCDAHGWTRPISEYAFRRANRNTTWETGVRTRTGLRKQHLKFGWVTRIPDPNSELEVGTRIWRGARYPNP